MLGKGKIEVSIPKNHFAPGEIISGTVKLTIKKPVTARGVNISLIGEHIAVRTSGMVSGGHMRSSTHREKRRVYEFKQDLDGEKEYTTGGDYNFEIPIPADILGIQGGTPEVSGALGMGMKMAQQALGGMRTSLKWYLRAKLDVPRGLDVKKDAQISIG
jgi:hypothetical protein